MATDDELDLDTLVSARIDLGTKLAAHSALEALRAALAALASCVAHHDRNLPAYAAVLPLRQAEDPLESIIEPETMWAWQARDRAANAIKAIDYVPGQHAVSTLRLPAILPASRETLHAARHANQAKDAFEAVISPLSDAQREELRTIQHDLRHVQLLAAYRHVHILDTKPDAIALAWSSRDTSNRVLSRKQAMRLAAQTRARAPLTDGHREHLAHTEHEAFACLDDDEFLVQRKPKSPTPIANLRYGDRQHAHGAMPFVMLYPHDPVHPELVPLRALPRLEGATRRASRMDRICEPTPLIPRIHLYRYLPAARPIMALPLLEAVEREAGHVVLSAGGQVLRLEDAKSLSDALVALAIGAREHAHTLDDGHTITPAFGYVTITDARGRGVRFARSKLNPTIRALADAA